MSRENHKIFQNPESAYFTGFVALQLWVQLWGGCNERKTITGGFDAKLSKMLQNKKIEVTLKVAPILITIYSIVKPNISLKSLRHSSHIQYFWSAVQ